ncbi:hypothetical protein D9M73_187780 [compost metagenome]
MGQRGAIGGLGDIAGLPVQLVAEARLQRRQFALAPAHGQDTGTAFQQTLDHGKADTGAGAGDHGKAILEFVL